MTANELIKILKEGWYTSDYDTVAASEVVRKLQSEIEELKPYKEKIEMMERAYDNHFKKASEK